jgi:hypothetical protein
MVIVVKAKIQFNLLKFPFRMTVPITEDVLRTWISFILLLNLPGVCVIPFEYSI